jgi:hypothetical protein
MLEHVGEVAGVERVAIIHAPSVARRGGAATGADSNFSTSAFQRTRCHTDHATVPSPDALAGTA